MKVPMLILTSVLLFVAIVILDLLTPQRLVAAILLNIPIALSGLVLKRRFTFALVVIAVVMDGVAGLVNAFTEGDVDSITVFNRVLLAASFILVGFMTVQLTSFSSRLEQARLEEARLRGERDRERIAGIGQEPSLEAALHKAAEVLTQCFEARGVLLASAGMSQFSAPRTAFPVMQSAWNIGNAIPSRLLGAPPSQPLDCQTPSEFGLNANHALIAGFEWVGHAPMLLALLEPQSRTESLQSLLPTLRDALERAELSQRLERNRTELERRAEVIRDLVYAFSHDLRTPLVANGMNMRLALEGAFGELPKDYLRTLHNGIEANEDLLTLADSLLVLAKLESEQIQSTPQAVDLENAARSSAARLPHSQFTWQVNGETIVLGNPADLRRIIQNLLENAAKYSPPDSQIEIILEPHENTVRLEIADRGQGVPVELEPRLFGRFSSGKVGGGTGLGLYLSKRISESHGGRIGYHPRVGGGSVFWLELPKAGAA
jgi:signal transduction histidine kinase